jgi:hypothetical protein
VAHIASRSKNSAHELGQCAVWHGDLKVLHKHQAPWPLLQLHHRRLEVAQVLHLQQRRQQLCWGYTWVCVRTTCFWCVVESWGHALVFSRYG